MVRGLFGMTKIGGRPNFHWGKSSVVSGTSRDVAHWHISDMAQTTLSRRILDFCTGDILQGGLGATFTHYDLGLHRDLYTKCPASAAGAGSRCKDATKIRGFPLKLSAMKYTL